MPLWQSENGSGSNCLPRAATPDGLAASELVDYRLLEPASVKWRPAGTGYALAEWLKSRGRTPQFVEFPKRDPSDRQDA